MGEVESQCWVVFDVKLAMYMSKVNLMFKISCTKPSSKAKKKMFKSSGGGDDDGRE